MRPDLRGVGVRPAGLQGVEQPERQVADQQERHRLPTRLWTSLVVAAQGWEVIFSHTFATRQVVQCCHWTVQCPLMPAQWPLHYLTPFSCPVCPIVQLLLTQSRLGLFNAHSRANMACL